MHNDHISIRCYFINVDVDDVYHIYGILLNRTASVQLFWSFGWFLSQQIVSLSILIIQPDFSVNIYKFKFNLVLCIMLGEKNNKNKLNN